MRCVSQGMLVAFDAVSVRMPVLAMCFCSWRATFYILKLRNWFEMVRIYAKRITA